MGFPPGRRRPPAIDRRLVRRHHLEFSYISGRYMLEHLARLYRAFDGDIVAALVLGTVGQHNARRFYDEVVSHSRQTYDELRKASSNHARLRPCNTMSISMSTGIPRETVRRKVQWLIQKGWLRREGRDKLYVTEAAAHHFMEFDTETVELFHEAAHLLMSTLEKVAARPKSLDDSSDGDVTGNS